MPGSRSFSADAYLAAIIESSDDAIIGSDVDGLIRSWNPAAEHLLGYSKAEALDRALTTLFVEPADRARAAASSSHIESVLRRRDGGCVEVSLRISAIHGPDASVIGESTIARDVSSHRRAEVAARRLAAIVESSDVAIISKDLNGIVTSWNHAAERMFEFTADEIVGRSITTLIPTERLSEEDFVLGRIRAGLPVEHFETVRQSKTGRLIDISLTVSPIRNANGVVIGASKIARDITEQKRLHEAQKTAIAREEHVRREVLEAENRRVQEASRMKSAFVANMSHELRTPLNSIIGFAELMSDERYGELPPKYKQFSNVMLKSGRHLLRLLDDILDLAKVEAGQIDFRPDWVNVRAIAEEVQSTLARAAEDRHVHLDVDVGPNLDEVYLDPQRLKQVLYNYLSNAIKFSSDGGVITIRARVDDGDAFRLEVVDHGIGITAEDQRLLFTEFQQLDAGTTKRYPGTGLGLALTRRIVEAQGGIVGVDSAWGSGSTFFARLPRISVARTASVSTSREPAETTQSH